MLGRGRSESAAYLAVQSALGPQSTGLVQKVRHLGCHTAEARPHPNHYGVVVDEIFDLCHWRLLVKLEMRGLGNIFRHQLRNALDVYLGASLACTFRDSL